MISVAQDITGLMDHMATAGHGCFFRNMRMDRMNHGGFSMIFHQDNMKQSGGFTLVSFKIAVENPIFSVYYIDDL